MKRISIFFSTILLAFSMASQGEETVSNKEITVYRSPTCGCCGKWIEHVAQNRFIIKDIISNDMSAIKKKYGVPANLASCHTAIVDGYVVEGHVPAADIEKMLETKPNIVGISAPGMPMGSPGMEMGGRADDFDVVSFDKAGHVEVFAKHHGGK